MNPVVSVVIINVNKLNSLIKRSLDSILKFSALLFIKTMLKMTEKG